MKAKVTVIIPTLNEEKHLPKLLGDLQNQTYKNFEVLVVDAKSEDKTCYRANEFEKKLQLRVITSNKKHLAFQRNLGARFAKGEFLCFLDADMHLESNFINKLVKYVDEDKFLVYLPIHIPHDAEVVDEILYKVIAVFVDASQMTNKPFSYGPGAIFQRHFFKHLGGYNEEVFVYEDQEIIQRARKQGVRAKLMTDNPLFFSYRRFKSDGRLSVLSKYTLATLYLLVHGKVDKKIFSYEMGGSAKYLLKEKKYFDIQEEAVKYFDKLIGILEK